MNGDNNGHNNSDNNPDNNLANNPVFGIGAVNGPDHETNLPAGDPILLLRQNPAPDHGPNFWANLEADLRQEPTPIGAIGATIGGGRNWQPVMLAAAAALVIIAGVAGLFVALQGNDTPKETITVNEPAPPADVEGVPAPGSVAPGGVVPDGEVPADDSAPVVTFDDPSELATGDASESEALFGGITDVSTGREWSSFGLPPRLVHDRNGLQLFAEETSENNDAGCMIGDESLRDELWASTGRVSEAGDILLLPVTGLPLSGTVTAIDTRVSDGRMAVATTCTTADQAPPIIPTDASPDEFVPSPPMPSFGMLIVGTLGENRTFTVGTSDDGVGQTVPVNPGMLIAAIDLGSGPSFSITARYDDGTSQALAGVTSLPDSFPDTGDQLLTVVLEDVAAAVDPSLPGPISGAIEGGIADPGTGTTVWLGTSTTGLTNRCGDGPRYFVVEVGGVRRFGGWLTADSRTAGGAIAVSPGADRIAVPVTFCSESQPEAVDIYQRSGDAYVLHERVLVVDLIGQSGSVSRVAFQNANVVVVDGFGVEPSSPDSTAVFETPFSQTFTVSEDPLPVESSPVDVIGTSPADLPPGYDQEQLQFDVQFTYDQYQTALNTSDVDLLHSTYSAAYRASADREAQTASIVNQSVRNWSAGGLRPSEVVPNSFEEVIEFELWDTTAEPECQLWTFTFRLVREADRWLIDDSKIVGGENPQPCAQQREITGVACSYNPESGVANPFGMRAFATIFESGADVVVRYEQFGNAANVGAGWTEKVYQNLTVTDLLELFDELPAEFDVAVFGDGAVSDSLWSTFRTAVTCE